MCCRRRAQSGRARTPRERQLSAFEMMWAEAHEKGKLHTVNVTLIGGELLTEELMLRTMCRLEERHPILRMVFASDGTEGAPLWLREGTGSGGIEGVEKGVSGKCGGEDLGWFSEATESSESEATKAKKSQQTNSFRAVNEKQKVETDDLRKPTADLRMVEAASWQDAASDVFGEKQFSLPTPGCPTKLWRVVLVSYPAAEKEGGGEKEKKSKLKQAVIFVLHHSVFDGTSRLALTRDFMNILSSEGKEEVKLQPYLDMQRVHRQLERMQPGRFRTAALWAEELRDVLFSSLYCPGLGDSPAVVAKREKTRRAEGEKKKKCELESSAAVEASSSSQGGKGKEEEEEEVRENTRLQPLELTEEETAALVAKCKHANTTVHAAVTAAVILSLLRLESEERKSALAWRAASFIPFLRPWFCTFHLASLRKSVEPPVEQGEIGALITGYRIFSPVTPEVIEASSACGGLGGNEGAETERENLVSTLWSLARDAKKRLIVEAEEPGKLGAIIMAFIASFLVRSLLGWIPSEYFSLKRVPQVNLSNLGRQDFQRGYGKFHLEGVFAATAEQAEGPLACVNLATVGSRLQGCVVFYTHVWSREKAEEFAGHIEEVLCEAALVPRERGGKKNR
uniref:Condensation domain-containing protein n=1 Tax=Chromera velia CCMP2878 TaxID=1169474 RepID=A0A0G4GYH1_9ALVE|eukprot:Cvel_23902.t1-p1 / transcript=Cvel_23902.t1 / gene=Cvel_23902 / organism=Chromera_velia_CCMP2878 / gene_product=hypothetical protein / transcript_product=hypothetical protein / location=Cvel_scaffold2520:10946-14910(+) / protein_length=624 / sequence_SO=supercontig / SO=protein_coding / is_pseudo=false